VALRIGKQVVKTGDLWALDIPATDTKTRRPLDYPISKELGMRIDLYLERLEEFAAPMIATGQVADATNPRKRLVHHRNGRTNPNSTSSSSPYVFLASRAASEIP
jgi:hypothetical protein